MKFPLSLWDISLWLAVTAIVLLITSEMISSHRYGKVNMQINKKKLHNAAIAVSIVFLATIVIRIINMLSSP